MLHFEKGEVDAIFFSNNNSVYYNGVDIIYLYFLYGKTISQHIKKLQTSLDVSQFIGEKYTQHTKNLCFKVTSTRINFHLVEVSDI